MWRLYQRLIPSPLRLPDEERRAVAKDASRRLGSRASATVPLLVFYVLVMKVVVHGGQWLVDAAGWPDWVAGLILFLAMAIAAGVILWTQVLFGMRRAIYEAIIARGHPCCPCCGYNRAGLDPAVACPECGGDPQRDRWDLATINAWERYQFRHLPRDQGWSLEVRQAIMRGAWYRLRHDRLGFSIYLLCLLIVVPLPVFAQALDHDIGSIPCIMVALLFYGWMESRLLRLHVQAELAARASQGPSTRR